MAKAGKVKQMTTGEALVESLLQHGIDTIFGLPGMQNDPLFDAFYSNQNKLRVLHSRHEQGVAYMALGAALATGKPQVCCVVPGPGMLNASAALLTAYSLNAPVLAVVGQIPQSDIERGHGHLHEIRDQKGIASHFMKSVDRISAPFQAPGIVRDAFYTMLSGRQGPAFIEASFDQWSMKGPVTFVDARAIDEIPVDDDAVEAAAKVLGSAKKPLILVGGGAIGAEKEVLKVAEMLEAPVTSYRRGRGVVPTNHRLAAALPIGHRLWKDADVVFIIGSRGFMEQGGWGLDKDLKVVRLDIDPVEPNRLARPAVALVGDSKDYLKALLKVLPKHNAKRKSRDEEMDGHRAWLKERLKKLEPQVSFLNAIRSALPEDGIFVDEVTQLGFASRIAFPIYKPRTYLSPGYQDNLGWGYGTALGAKVACPDVPVVSIGGDGGFMYQVQELATAVRHNIGVVNIVFDNGLFGNVRRIQQEQFNNRTIASDLHNPDFYAMARDFGMASYRATTARELEVSLKEAFSLNAPALVHVPCGEMPSPWDMLQMPRVRG